MKKKLLFSMAAISILAVGLMIWSCGDDDNPPPPPPVTIELTASLATINADDSNAGTTITITAEVTGGSNVAFEVTEKPTGSTASVPAAGVAVASGEAATELSAGTVTGTIVVTGTVGEVSAEAAVTVTAGAPAGIIKGPIGVLPCPEPVKIAFPTQLVDAFDNPAPQAGVSVTFDTSEGSLAKTTVTTDDIGQATAGLLLAEGLTAVVTAIYINGVTFDMVTGGDRLLIPPNAAEIELASPPSFRTNTAIIDPDTTDNILGLVGFLVNEDLDGAMKDGTVNLIYALGELETVSGENDIMFIGVTGQCGVPGTVVNCTGTQIEYYIDPGSLDDCNYPLIFAKGTVTDGALSVSLGELILGFPVDDLVIELKLCDVEVAGKVKVDLSEITGDIVESTYCPGGCASLAGFITEDELCALVDAALEPGMCDLAKGLLGDTDGDCSGEPAYSMRLLFKANAVDLFEAP